MPLDEAIRTISRANIDHALFAIADPRKSNFTDGILPDDLVERVIPLLERKFEEGWSILQELVNDCVSSCTRPNLFKPLEVSSSYELLEALMGSRPNKLVDKIKVLYERYEKDDAAKRRLRRDLEKGEVTPEELVLVRLSHHTHKWRQQVEKPKKGVPNPFGYLRWQDYRFGRVEFHVVDNPNAHYPHYLVHSWIKRLKTSSRVVEKFISRLMVNMIKAGDDYNMDIEVPNEKDYSAGRIITFDWFPQARIGKFLSSTGKWKVKTTRDQRHDSRYDGKDIGNFVYGMYRTDRPDILIELQLVPLPDTLLFDFFAKDRHDLWEMRRHQQAERYRRHPVYGSDYTRMEYNLKRVLPFLQPKIITS